MVYPSSGSAPTFAVEYQSNSGTWVDISSSTNRFNIEAEIFDPLHPVRGQEALIEVSNFLGNFNPMTQPALSIGRLMQVRITETNSKLFTGRIKNINMNPDPSKKTAVLALESLLAFYDRTTVTTALQTGVNPASLFALLMSSVNSTSGLYSAEVISSLDNITYAWYQDVALSGALQQIVDYGFYPMSEHGDGVLQLYSRSTGLVGGGSAVDTVINFFDHAITWDSEMMLNNVKVSGNPRAVATSPATVAWLGQVLTVAASSSIGFWLTYVDPIQNALTTPAVSLSSAVNADWVLNSAADGTGADLSGTASLSPTYFGDTAVVSLFNGSGNTAYLTKFQLQGYSVRQISGVSFTAQDATSQTNYGVHQKTFSNDFVNKQAHAQNYSQFLVGLRSTPTPRLTFSLKNDWPTMDKIMPGVNVALVNANAGVDSLWVVRRVAQDVSLDNGIDHTMQVEAEYFDNRPWLILDHPVRGMLDSGNQLSW